jgi:hypothetical protein
MRARLQSDGWVLVACAGFYLGISILLLEVFPPPLPDEMLFTSPAYSLIRDGTLGTPAVAGMERHAFWMPLLYFVTLASVFKICGAGLVTAALYDAYFVYLYRFKLRSLTSAAELASQVIDAIPDRASVMLLGVPNLSWQLEGQRNAIALYYPWSLDLRSETLLARRVQIVIVAGAFSASYDKYVGEELMYWSDRFEKEGRHLRLLREVGQELPYTFRARVYAIK